MIAPYDPIPRQQTKIFAPRKNPSAGVSNLKEDVHLFSRLFIISTARDLDLKEFFKYENEKFPPSLSVKGMLRPGFKAPLTEILEKLVTSDVPKPSNCSGVVFDGAALVHLVKPKPNTISFKNYCDIQLKPYLMRVANEVQAKRIDVAWDMYDGKSLKSNTRENRGTGLRQHDLPNKGNVDLKFCLIW